MSEKNAAEIMNAVEERTGVKIVGTHGSPYGSMVVLAILANDNGELDGEELNALAVLGLAQLSVAMNLIAPDVLAKVAKDMNVSVDYRARADQEHNLRVAAEKRVGELEAELTAESVRLIEEHAKLATEQERREQAQSAFKSEQELRIEVAHVRNQFEELFDKSLERYRRLERRLEECEELLDKYEVSHPADCRVATGGGNGACGDFKGCKECKHGKVVAEIAVYRAYRAKHAPKPTTDAVEAARPPRERNYD